MNNGYYQADGASDNLVNNIPVNDDTPQASPVQSTQPAQVGGDVPSPTTANTATTEQENPATAPAEPFVAPWDPPKSESPDQSATPPLGEQAPSESFVAPESATQTPPAADSQTTPEAVEPVTTPNTESAPDMTNSSPVAEEDPRMKSFEASLAQEIQRNGEAVSQENIAERVFMARANGTITAKIENFQELNDEQLRKAYELWDWHKAGEILSKVGQDNSVL